MSVIGPDYRNRHRMKSFLKMGVHILDPKRDSGITKQRLLLATMLVLVLTMVVLGRLYFLQVVKHDRYRTLSVENRIGLLPVPPV